MTETTVPDGESPAADCPHCGQPFRTERLRDLHVGEDHEDVATEAELAAYREARDEEGDELFVFHLKTVAALTVLYAMMVLLYMAVIGYTG